ncbi:MAG: NINE protein [Myxococcales bacterium]|nr:NINE protein [Myxococcales bacterium]
MTHSLTTAPLPRRSLLVGYLFWAAGLLGFCGLHRFYTGRIWTGLLWFFTGGLLFIGQLVDVFLVPGQTRRPQ